MNIQDNRFRYAIPFSQITLAELRLLKEAEVDGDAQLVYVPILEE